jgi:hypothetical protein
VKIDVTINPDGTVRAEVIDGPGGAACVKELERLLAGLGTVQKTVKKREFYAQATAGQKGKVSQ